MDKWIFFDVDDVLVDTSAQIERAMRKLTGIHIPSDTWTHHLFSEMYKIGPERRDEMRALWVDEKVLEQARVFEGVTEAMEQLSGDGYRLGLITARAWHPNARAITEDFVNAHRLPIEDIKLMTYVDSKAELLSRSGFNVEAFVDDTTRHAQGCDDAGIPSVLVTRPWNLEAPASLPRIASIAEFPHWVRNNAQRMMLEEALNENFAKRRTAPAMG